MLSVPPGEDDRVVLTIVSHTTSLRGSPFKVVVPIHFLKEGAFAAQSIVTIPAQHAPRRLGRLTPEQMAPIEDGVRRWLAL